ncbi:ornithine cyclodeaminase family protein [Nocardioides sp. Root151]|uniref:ornithine cyclodeaminase family protein n=1 Tax=Nocardioides sp. Root151 TaxID=1736475 RepID=UPI000702603F|nr:ornithine cyclodeaminase family protein [Nocardioides sp. Root151]KQZ67502.1 ornithine cyclodeaminase [Nocardioides sp. Root151]
MTIVLTRSDVAEVIDMTDVIEVVEQAHLALASGDAIQPERAAFELKGSDVLYVPMVAGIGSMEVGGVKLMTDTPSNRARGLPAQQSAILLADGTSGAPKALIDGGIVTRFRTAAASAVATRHLANPSGGCLGLIGAGGQARAHLEAIRLVRPVDRVLVWTRSSATAAGFVEHARQTGVHVEVADSVEDVVSQADILCTLTPSREPLVSGAWFRPGMHINAVGAPPRVDHREIDSEGIRRSLVVVDRVDVARQESGDVMIPFANGDIGYDHFDLELGEVASGSRPGRSSPDQITLYNSVGLAIQDMATARMVVEKALLKGLGRTIDLGS